VCKIVKDIDIQSILPIIPNEYKKKKYYTGVGSRETPDKYLIIINKISKILAQLNYILRSGGAKGSDKAFENGCDYIDNKLKEIYYPNDATEESMVIARKYHKGWFKCTEYAKKLHGRNTLQVLGKNLKTPSEFVICYTKDGCLKHKDRNELTGGTGTAISIADKFGIPIINLGIDDHYKQIKNWLRNFP